MKETKRMHRYGMTPDEYNQMYVDQEGCCYLCGKHEDELPKVLHVDHCHLSGRVRKLLCFHCNAGLGHFSHDTNLLRKATAYLVEHNNKI